MKHRIGVDIKFTALYYLSLLLFSFDLRNNLEKDKTNFSAWYQKILFELILKYFNGIECSGP